MKARAWRRQSVARRSNISTKRGLEKKIRMTHDLRKRVPCDIPPAKARWHRGHGYARRPSPRWFSTPPTSTSLMHTSLTLQQRRGRLRHPRSSRATSSTCCAHQSLDQMPPPPMQPGRLRRRCCCWRWQWRLRGVGNVCGRVCRSELGVIDHGCGEVCVK